MIWRILLSVALMTIVPGPSVFALTEVDPRCATPDPSIATMEAVQARIETLLADRGTLGEKAQLTIPVAFHVLYYQSGLGVVGQVDDATLIEQIDVLNGAFAATGVQFILTNIDRTESQEWCKLCFNSPAEEECKEALSIDPATTLNIYTGELAGKLLGWSWFPWDFPEDDTMHGVVMHFQTLPGGNFFPYHLGDTAAHEVGHYLGLYHTFQGGCTLPNDYCDDTPMEAEGAYRCPVGQDSCPSDPGLDPITNYMDSTDDLCMVEFTPQQTLRMELNVEVYRPTLLLGTTTPAWGLPEQATTAQLSIAPNPFNPRTEISFTLVSETQVRLDIFDLAGRQVSPLVDQTLAAGDHCIPFDGQGLASGVYLLRFATGEGQELRERMVLLK